MSKIFREFVKKIGSGPHTGDNLTRSEAAEATKMILLKEATPAQIGAFMIAHRIKRPTGEELAGMLDTYETLGPKLQPCSNHGSPVVVFGVPYDGRDRIFPISHITALILTSMGQSVIMHGGDIMPTKYGVSLVKIWQDLGVNFTHLSLEKIQKFFEKTGLGFIYLPQHFPQAADIVQYREEIGKRPPFATMELIWQPFNGDAHIMAGFVHPPTENMFKDAFQLRGYSKYFTTIKGLEGSIDLPRDRTAIIGLFAQDGNFERLLLSHNDYHISSKNPPLDNQENIATQIKSILDGEESELFTSAIWNGGFYLWRCGLCEDIKSGILLAQSLLKSGKVKQKLAELINSL